MNKDQQKDYVMEAIEAAKNRIIQYAAKLYTLENDFGFDLDVATDVYGLDLFDPSEQTDSLIKSWQTLLEALSKPNKIITIVQPYTQKLPGCTGFGGKAITLDHIRVTFIKNNGGTIQYKKAKGEEELSSIVLPDVEVATVDNSTGFIHHEQLSWEVRDLLMAKPLISHEAHTGDLGCFSQGVLGPGAPDTSISTHPNISAAQQHLVMSLL